MRTLRQLPRPVGETGGGDPIVEVRSVRLVLRGDATHLRRLVACSTCGREAPGPPVLGPADLDRPPPPVTCEDCARAGRASAASAPDPRPPASGERVEQAATVAAQGRLTEAVEALRQELKAELRDRLADVRASMPTVADDVAGRLDALDDQARRREAEASELAELHAALDVGLGTLRSDLAQLRAIIIRLAADQADLNERFDAFIAVPPVPEAKKGRRGRKAAREAEVAGRMAAVQTALDDVTGEHRRLKAQLATLQQASEGATAAATRASHQASALGPLRTEVGLVRQQLTEQKAALDTLRTALERRRPVTKRAPRAT